MKIGNVFRACNSSSAKKHSGFIEIVANVNKIGKAKDVEMQPNIMFSECIVKGVEDTSFPKPPSYNKNGFPIRFKMELIN